MSDSVIRPALVDNLTNTKCTQNSTNFLRKQLPLFAQLKKWRSGQCCWNHFHTNLELLTKFDKTHATLLESSYQTYEEGRGCLLNQLPPAKINSGHVGFCLCRSWISLRCLSPCYPRTLLLLFSFEMPCLSINFTPKKGILSGIINLDSMRFVMDKNS